MQNPNKKTLLGLVLIFTLPLLLAVIVFQWVSSTGGQSTTNYGTLISPVRPVSHVKDDQNLFKGKWSLVVFAEHCTEACANRLKTAETLRILTNDNMRRLQTIVVSVQPLERSRYPDNIQVHNIQNILLDQAQYQQMLAQFSVIYDEQNIFLVDPLANAMMSYPAQSRDVKYMLTDLKRLLKYSRIG